MSIRMTPAAVAMSTLALVVSGCAIVPSATEPRANGTLSATSPQPVASPPSEPLPPAIPNPDPAIADACGLAKPALVRLAESQESWQAEGDYSVESFDRHATDIFMQIAYLNDTAQHPDLQSAITYLGGELAAAVIVHQEAAEKGEVTDNQRLAVTAHAMDRGFDEIFALCLPED